MNELRSYERLVRRKVTGKYVWQRVGLIALYFVWLSIWFVIAIRFILNAPLVAFALLSTVLLVIFTWKLTIVEYEYTIVGGSFYLAQIYGKSRRKAILEAELSDAVLIAPYTEEYASRAEALSPTEILWATSATDAPNIWMLVWDADKEERLLLFFEADERSVRLLHHYNPRVTAREKITDPTDPK